MKRTCNSNGHQCKHAILMQYTALMEKVDIVNVGCLTSTAWDFDFGAQLLLPVLIAVFAFTPYLVRLVWNQVWRRNKLKKNKTASENKSRHVHMNATRPHVF